MEKAIISNRIYFKPRSNAEFKELIEKLTYRIETKNTNKRGVFKNIEIIKNYRILPNGVISVPQGRSDLVPQEYELVDKRVINEVPFPTPLFSLREGQQVIYDEVNDSCFINALVGWGKTFTALHLAAKLGQKTLVVTHTTMLRDQWVDEVKALFNMTPGIIGSGKFDLEDHAIVVGNIQTITKHIGKISKEFGTVILDEAHHVPASTFASVIDGLYARYRIALSGTMQRTDGKHIIFKDYFGPRVYKPPQSHTMNPVVKIIPTGVHLPPGETCILITGETGYEERKELIEQVETGSKMCVAGSRQIFSEGISINRLSCVILAVPTSNPISLEQIIGRIMRLHPDKPDPVVLDLNFSSIAERKQNASRLAFYAGKGWEIKKYD